MIFAFEFQLSIDKLTAPAAEAEKSIGKVTAALAALRKATDSIDGLLGRVGSRLGRGIDGERAARAARSNGAKIADEWQRMAAKAEAAEARATKAAEREAQRRLAIKERESKAQERMWARIAFAAQRAQDRAAEQAARKPWFGGQKSVMDLLSSRAEAKVSGLATGAADAALGLPGMLLGGVGGLALSGVKAAAGAAIDLAKWSGEAAINFGQMAVSAQALREQSVAGFESIFGNQEVADRLFNQAVRIAKLTKFDTPEVVQRFNDLAAGGFKAAELPMMFSAIADIESARGSNYAGRFSLATQKLNAQPSALFSTFQQGAMAGPGLKLAEEMLAKRMGIKDTNVDAALRKAFREKKITGTQAIEALLDATSNRYDQGGMLGTFARKQGEGTWEGLISNIRNGLSDVLTMKLPADHPMLKFKDILRAVNSLFDENTARGKRFQALMSRLVEDVFRVFDLGDGGETKLGQAMDNLLNLADALEAKIRGVSFWIRDNITRPLMEGLSGDVGLSLGQRLKSSFIDLGMLAGQAFAVGALEMMGLTGQAKKLRKSLHAGAVRDSALDLQEGDAARAAAGQKYLEAQRAEQAAGPQPEDTPSWLTPTAKTVNANIAAEDAADALGIPKMATGGLVRRPTLALIGERGPEYVVPAGKMGGVVIQGGLHFHLPQGLTGNTPHDAAMLGQALMSWVAQQTRSPSAATQPGA